MAPPLTESAGMAEVMTKEQRTSEMAQQFNSGDEQEAYEALLASGHPEPTNRAERRRLQRHIKKALGVKASNRAGEDLARGP